MKLFKFIFLFFAFLLSPFLIESSTNAQSLVYPKKISVSVEGLKDGLKTLFIPITASPEGKIELSKTQLKELILSGYTANIETDQDGNLVGISFSAFKGRSLPDKLDIEVQVKPDKDISYSDNAMVQLVWKSPWLFDKSSYPIKGGFAGINQMDLGQYVEGKQKKKKIDEGFYVKSLGQTLTKENKNGRVKEFQDGDYGDNSNLLLQKMNLFVITPSKGDFKALYLPIFHSAETKLQVQKTTDPNSPIIRAVNNNLLEIVPAQGDFLPQNAVIETELTLVTTEKSVPIEKIILGELFSSPFQVIPANAETDVSVKINPGTISVGKRKFNPFAL